MLPIEAVIEWQKLYSNLTGTDLSLTEATVRANRMFKYLQTITKPDNIIIYKKGDKSEK